MSEPNAHSAVSFTDSLRDRVKAALDICPTCGGPRGSTSRENGERIGIPHASLWRFLRGKAPSAETIDKLVAWLEAEGKGASS